jgi:hypothetical protein
MIHFRKHLLFTALFLSTLLFMAFSINGRRQKDIRPSYKITIAYIIELYLNPAQLAFAKNCFQVEGLSATLKLHDLGISAFQAYISRVHYGHA